MSDAERERRDSSVGAGSGRTLRAGRRRALALASLPPARVRGARGARVPPLQGRPVLTALATAFLLAQGGCAGEELPTRPLDRIAPVITIVHPQDRSVVTTDRPTFVIRVTDQGSGVFITTVRATLEGVDVSQIFRSAFDEAAGEFRVQGQVQARDGTNRLRFAIADRSGNDATAEATFVVAAGSEPPPVPD